MDFFSADFHFCHKGVMHEKNCNRPFNSLQEMHEVLIKNINDVVKKNDTLYIEMRQARR